MSFTAETKEGHSSWLIKFDDCDVTSYPIFIKKLNWEKELESVQLVHKLFEEIKTVSLEKNINKYRISIKYWQNSSN